MKNMEVTEQPEVQETKPSLSISEKLKFYTEEFLILKRETDWRLQIAYAGPTAYITSLFVAIGFAINTLRDINNLSNSGIEIGILAITFVLANAMFIGVFVGNHFIEKKMELYMLELQTKIYELTGDDYFGWITYQHGSKKHVSKLDIFAHAGVGFQYGIPAVLAITTLVAVPFLEPLNGPIVFLYGFAVFAMLVALMALLIFIRLTLQVKNQFAMFHTMVDSTKLASSNIKP